MIAEEALPRDMVPELEQEEAILADRNPPDERLHVVLKVVLKRR